jgi:hypothetical protein
LLSPFDATHPGVTISPVVESTRHALDALDAGAVDLAIATERRPDARYERLFVFDDELMVALSPSRDLARKERVDHAELHSERLLVHPPSEADRLWFQQSDGCDVAAWHPAHCGNRQHDRVDSKRLWLRTSVAAASGASRSARARRAAWFLATATHAQFLRRVASPESKATAIERFRAGSRGPLRGGCAAGLGPKRSQHCEDTVTMR